MVEYFEYTPTEWKAGDTVTSAKLNKIEEALKNLVLYVHAIYEEDTATLDKTWAEIYAAPMVFLVDEGGKFPLQVMYTESEDDVMYYYIQFKNAPEIFSCSSEDEYPYIGQLPK